MALPTCECVAGLPIGEQLSAIYCATYTLAVGDVDGPYLLKAANLSDVADPDLARGNISAAESGVNTDITSLGGVLNIGAGGATPTAATYPTVIAYPSATQALTSGGTEDILVWGGVLVDTAAAFAGNAFTVPANASGLYAISISGIYLTGGDPTIIFSSIFVNGVLASLLCSINPTASWNEPTLDSRALIELSAGDVLTIRARQVNGVAWTIQNLGSTGGKLSINRVFSS